MIAIKNGGVAQNESHHHKFLHKKMANDNHILRYMLYLIFDS